MSDKQMLILGSGSPRRLALLQQAGIEPDRLHPADIDETPQRGEVPRTLVNRLARTKAEMIRLWMDRDAAVSDAYAVTADTVVAVGRRVLPKAEMLDEAETCLELLSGRSHRVYTSVCVVNPKHDIRQKLVETRVRFKRLGREEVADYLASGEWRGKAGGYAIQGLAGSFVVKLTGSYTNVVGLPLFETVSLLSGEGYRVRAGWIDPLTSDV
ncbi:Maf-like protein [Rhodobium gokarnense]|uniref:dTTP/UTP pyrophosphatase n=1 Tax=Rhodobium gokarnense TaxID=364296 RepID=A0ABT3HC92_9HYPH|nr:Maf-like protein [Rhodobium gokarnense]MCW2308016.1 septum formation protein [Rhodobium gokarnense]